jgi:enoyl-CoA hydratase/carnithine racemase
MDAHEALRRGLLPELTDEGGHLDRAIEVARELAAQPRLAVTTAKRVIDAAAESSRESALLLERLAYAALNRTT